MLNQIKQYLEVEWLQRTRFRQKSISKFEGKQTRLKRLAPSTIKRRKRLKKQGKLSNEATPRKSNLTETGKMLNAMRFKVRGKKISFGFKGKENLRKAEAVSTDRPFANFTRKDVKFIEKAVIDAVIKSFK